MMRQRALCLRIGARCCSPTKRSARSTKNFRVTMRMAKSALRNAARYCANCAAARRGTSPPAPLLQGEGSKTLRLAPRLQGEGSKTLRLAPRLQGEESKTLRLAPRLQGEESKTLRLAPRLQGEESKTL